MKPILDAEERPALDRYFRPETLVVFDYDGTLAPIVNTPAEAHMRPGTRDLLIRVARRYQAVVVSGRARLDVLSFLRGVPLLDVIGNHGFETAGVAHPQVLGRVREWLSELQLKLDGVPGLHIEDKRYSLSLHYRACPDPSAALATIREAVGALQGARLVGGKAVVNVVLQEAPHKGAALQHVRRRLGEPPVIFIGDDETDEDVFAGDHGPHFLGIRVGCNGDSDAEYCLKSQEDIDSLLALLEDGARHRAGGT